MGKELKTCNVIKTVKIQTNIKKPYPRNIYSRRLFRAREKIVTNKYKKANGKPEKRNPIDSWSTTKEDFPSCVETMVKKSSVRPIKSKHDMHKRKRNNVITRG
jgi:hypothetical protein